jgi:hypothetical protein
MSGLLAERAKLVAVCFQASPNYKSTLFVADGKMVIPQPYPLTWELILNKTS